MNSPLLPPILTLLAPLPLILSANLSMDHRGTATVTGVPENAHALLIGESGGNVHVLHQLGVKVFLNNNTVQLSGYPEAVETAYEGGHYSAWRGGSPARTIGVFLVFFFLSPFFSRPLILLWAPL